MTNQKRRAETMTQRHRREPWPDWRGGWQEWVRWASRLLIHPGAKLAVVLAILVAVVGALRYVPALTGAQSEAPAIDRALLGSKADLTSAVVGISEGQRAPRFSLTSIDGRKIVYDSGKPRVIFFMASWCIPCVAEERALARVHRKYGDKVEIVTVDVDLRNDTVADLQEFQRRWGDDWPHALNVELAMLFRVRSLDTTYVLNRNNVITYLDMWPTDFETLEREVLKVLPAKAS